LERTSFSLHVAIQKKKMMILIAFKYTFFFKHIMNVSEKVGHLFD